MRKHLPKLASAFVLVACCVSSVSCYYPAYGRGYENSAYNQDSKGGEVAPQEPMPQARPRYVGVDPALAVAGVAAAGLLGYAIGHNRGHGHYDHGYYGPAYYRPVAYGYYGRGYCR
jgi:hypothetical protein